MNFKLACKLIPILGCLLGVTTSAVAANNDIMIQGFDWNSGSGWWSTVQGQAGTLQSAGFTMVWLPPCSATADSHGYLPTMWYDLNDSPYGNQSALVSCINSLHADGMKVIGDIVIQHRCGDATPDADFSNPVFGEGQGSSDTTNPNNARAVCDNDPCGCGTGAPDTYEIYSAGRNLDHTWSTTQSTIEAWMNWLKSSIGFDGWRYDFTLGYGPSYVGLYNSATSPYFSVGEYWDTSTSDESNWVNASGSPAFDFATKNTLDAVINNNNYSYLTNGGSAPGLIGVNPTKAVTFVDDHDTAATGGQDLLPMPSAGIQQAYVYILTHPGVPCVFWDEYYANESLINTLISIRKSQGITAASSLSIQSATTSVYAAIINGNTAMKIGPGAWSPTGNWTLTTSGTNYAVWTLAATQTAPTAPTGLTATPGNASVSLAWSASSGSGPITYNVSRGTSSGGETLLITGVNSASYTDTAAVNGTKYYYVVSATNSAGTSGNSNEASATPASSEAPFGGTPAAIPGTVQAENYDTGGQGVAYNVTSVNGSADSYRSDDVDLETTSDTGGGYDLGWTSSGQWFKYTVNVSTAGGYAMTFRVAANAAVGTTGGSFHLQNASGANLSGSVSVPGTGGWQTWENVTANVTLPAGQQVLELYQDTGGYNVNYMTFASTASAPPAPTGLSATVGNATVSLTWSTSSGATSYNVYRGTSSGGEGSTAIGTSTSASYTDSSVTNGTTYYYTVKAVSSSGTSAASNEASATPSGISTAVYQIDCGSGSAISPFVADEFFSGGTEFSSTNTINTSGVTNPAPSAVYQTVRWGAMTYTIPNLTAGQSYTVRLHFCELTWTAAGQRLFNVAINGTSYLSNFDVFATAGGQNKALVEQTTATANSSGQIVIAFTVGSADNPEIAGIEIDGSGGGGGSAPPTPTGLSATSGNMQISLTWSSSSGATSYNVYRGTTSDGESSTAIAIGLTNISYINTGLTNGTTYFYKVAAVNSVGTSGLSNEASATPQPSIPPAPTGLTATAGNAQASLTWTGSSGATSYNVYRGTSAGGESSTAVATGLTGTSYTNTGLTNGTTYYYKVAAVNSAGTSGMSNEASATPTAGLTAVYQIDCGSSSAVSPFVADEFFSAGNEFSSTATINTSGVTNAAPAAVYQTVRWNSSFSYTIPNLTAGASYTVRLHFCELTWTAAGQRVFNVAINGNSYLSSFDIFKTAGAENKALVEQTTATANSSGQIVISFTQGSADNPEIAGIEILH